MFLVPGIVVVLLVRGRHLVEGLLLGVLSAALIGLGSGLLTPSQLLYIDGESYLARGLLLEGLERGVGISILTLLLLGLVATLQATGVLARVVGFAQEKSRSARGSEWWIFGAITAALFLTMHSVVAILTVGDFARETGARFALSSYRRSNILDVTSCTYPFLLPYCIPTILAAGTTVAGESFGMPRVSPLDTGLANFHSFMLLIVVVFAIATGYGRSFVLDRMPEESI